MIKKLSAPFPPDRISWRVGSTTADKKRGMALAYIDARDVMERLDSVCGPGGWQCRYPHVNAKTCCEIGIKFESEWVWKADGAGDTDYEGEKGAFSDSFKRAAVKWGIGRYLYDLDSPWVEIEPMGKSFKIKESEYPRLRRVLGQVPETNGHQKPSDGWHGPLKVTELKAALRALAHDLHGAADMDDLDRVISDNRAVIEQCQRDLPDWYDGKSGNGYLQTVAGIRAQLQQQTQYKARA